MVVELRAPTSDLCDLGLSVDPGTVFVSLYFAQVLRESCLCFRTNLKPAQQLRSARLLAILTQAFAE